MCGLVPSASALSILLHGPVLGCTTTYLGTYPMELPCARAHAHAPKELQLVQNRIALAFLARGSCTAPACLYVKAKRSCLTILSQT